MKQAVPLLLFTSLVSFIISCKDRQQSHLLLLSDQNPTDSALIFAPGIISTDAFEFAITFSPEMDELFFTRRAPDADNEIYTMRLIDGNWSEPKVAFFKADEGWDFEPHINPSGDRLYFGSLRPLPDSTEGTGLHQWYCEKSQSGWSQPVPLRGPFLDRIAMYLTAATNGNLYYTSWMRADGEIKDNGIYYSINEEGAYHSMNKMGAEINRTELNMIAHSYIAPDESYVLFDGKSDSTGYGSCDLYISFKHNGTWTDAQNLGPLVNTELCEFTASVSPDGKYLFFHRGVVSEEEESGNIYWIAFDTIKEQLHSAQLH